MSKITANILREFFEKKVFQVIICVNFLIPTCSSVCWSCSIWPNSRSFKVYCKQSISFQNFRVFVFFLENFFLLNLGIFVTKVNLVFSNYGSDIPSVKIIMVIFGEALLVYNTKQWITRNKFWFTWPIFSVFPV